MSEENEFLRRDLDEVRHVLFGVNSDNGIRMRFRQMEIAVNELIESRKEQKRWFKGIAASIIVVGCVSAGSWLWNAAKVQATQQVMEQTMRQINAVANGMAPVSATSDAASR